MLYAKDLMIGDWVNVTAAENIVPPGILSILPKKGKVVGIDGDCIFMDFVEHPFMFGDIEPIPITTEILEKNGFDLEGNGASFPCFEDSHLAYMIEWGYHDGTPILKIASYHPNVKNYGTFLKHGVNNVHDLQHALRLCRIEKEVVL